MKPFTAPLGDILFTLEHVAGAPDIDGWDADTAAALLEHFARFAEGEIAPLNEIGDREGCTLADGRVALPAAFRRVYADYAAQGWHTLPIAEAHGGQGLPAVLQGAVTEMLVGACHAFQMTVGLVPGGMRVLESFATEEQAARLIGRLAGGDVLVTMCLTEPGAGSDLSGVRTRAVADGGVWRVSGEKIFISGGDQDLSGDILHFVLARTGAAEDGVKGLSLFACPSRTPDGARNAISVARIEEKMGVHASPTCQLAFDGAEGELVGAVGDGLRCMFALMNHARLDVALQGVAHAARSFDISSAYAAERRQGRRPGADGAVAIDRHPDVRRMLLLQDALALGGRAMALAAVVCLDKGDDPALLDFLTPVCKAFCTDAGTEAADLAIQVLGGYGYLAEYRVEQHWRDARIARIYEGTNGIHALTLAGRLLTLGGGACADAFAAFVETLVAEAGAASLDGTHAEQALAEWRALRADVAAAADPAAVAHAFMKLTGLVLFLALWLRIEAKAEHAADPQRLRATAAFVRRHFAPEVALWAARCRAELAA